MVIHSWYSPVCLMTQCVTPATPHTKLTLHGSFGRTGGLVIVYTRAWQSPTAWTRSGAAWIHGRMPPIPGCQVAAGVRRTMEV